MTNKKSLSGITELGQAVEELTELIGEGWKQKLSAAYQQAPHYDTNGYAHKGFADFLIEEKSNLIGFLKKQKFSPKAIKDSGNLLDRVTHNLKSFPVYLN